MTLPPSAELALPIPTGLKFQGDPPQFSSFSSDNGSKFDPIPTRCEV